MNIKWLIKSFLVRLNLYIAIVENGTWTFKTINDYIWDVAGLYPIYSPEFVELMMKILEMRQSRHANYHIEIYIKDLSAFRKSNK